MFGYIRPFEPQLRICELEEYRAVYCGLCRSLGKRFGPMARMTLSYDFAFFTMLAFAVGKNTPTYSKQRCPFFPVKKRLHLDLCEETALACDDALLLLREKCADNVSDERFFKASLWKMLSFSVNHAARKAAASRPDADHICREMTLRQQQTEQSETVSVDTACAPSAEMLGLLLEGLSSSEEEKRILNRLGYMLGRFVYLCDAVDDLEKDKKHGAFNPLNSQNVHPDEAEGMLRLTIAEACRAYDLLSPQCYRGVLDNIMFLGLQNTADSLLTRRRQDEKSI